VVQLRIAKWPTVALQTRNAIMARGFGDDGGDGKGKKEENENDRFLGDM
jgi:hypothetical protein